MNTNSEESARKNDRPTLDHRHPRIVESNVAAASGKILFGGARGGGARWCLEHRVGQVGADYATGGVDLDGEIRRTTRTARLGWAGIGAGRPECEHRTRKQNEGFASTDQDGPL